MGRGKLRWLVEARAEVAGQPPPKRERRVAGRPWKPAVEWLRRAAVNEKVPGSFNREDGLELLSPLEGACYDCRDTELALHTTKAKHEFLNEEGERVGSRRKRAPKSPVEHMPWEASTVPPGEDVE